MWSDESRTDNEANTSIADDDDDHDKVLFSLKHARKKKQGTSAEKVDT